MEFLIHLFLMGDARLQMIMFLVVGVISYFIDYKKFSQYSETHREAALSKGITLTFIIGSLTGLVGITVAGWFI